MKIFKIASTFTAFSVLSFSNFATAKDYVADPDHSSVNFTVTHLGFSHVKGKFKKYEGTFSIDDKTKKITAVEGSIAATSIDTDNDKRDEHLRSAEFFNVAKFPSITFKLKKYDGEAKSGTITGDLTMHGVTKSVTLKSESSGAVKDPYGNDRFGIRASGNVNRQDFGVAWSKTFNKAGDLVVSNDIVLDLDIEGIAKTKEPAPKK